MSQKFTPAQINLPSSTEVVLRNPTWQHPHPPKSLKLSPRTRIPPQPSNRSRSRNSYWEICTTNFLSKLYRHVSEIRTAQQPPNSRFNKTTTPSFKDKSTSWGHNRTPSPLFRDSSKNLEQNFTKQFTHTMMGLERLNSRRQDGGESYGVRDGW